MSFFHRTPEERDARAALKAAKSNLYVAKTQVKTAKAQLRTTKAGRKARKITLQTQRVAERDEARYVTATDRLERDRVRGRAKPVRVRGSSRSRRYSRRRPR
jgi:hypothetical protein